MKSVLLNRRIAAGSALLTIATVAWNVIDAWGNIEFAAQKLQLVIHAPVLAWIGNVPDWSIIVAASYSVAWLAWGRSETRPRLVLEATDDGRPVEPQESHLFLENIGDADAFDVQVSNLVFPNYVIEPILIARLKAGGKVEVNCDLKWKDRPNATDYDRPLARSLSWVFRALDVLNGECKERFKEGSICENVKVRYGDHDGRRYSTCFTIPFAWAIEKFEQVQLYRPTWRELVAAFAHSMR